MFTSAGWLPRYMWEEGVTLCMAMPLCGVILLLVFHDFVLVCFLLLPFMFEGLGNWFGRREGDGVRGELNEFQ